MKPYTTLREIYKERDRQNKMIDPNNKELKQPDLLSNSWASSTDLGELQLQSTGFTPQSLISTQPNPIPNQSKPIVDLVIEELLRRKQVSEQFSDVLELTKGKDELRCAFDKAIDLVFYLYQAIQERDQNK